MIVHKYEKDILKVTTNLPGQFCALQASVSLELPEQVPPYFSTTDFVRLLVRVPTPHDLVQVDQDCQDCQMQSTKRGLK